LSKKRKKIYHKGQVVSFQDAPKEVQELMKELVVMCPFRKKDFSNLENLDIKFTRQADGWEFVCKACPDTECTGFILDAPRSPRKAGARFLRV